LPEKAEEVKSCHDYFASALNRLLELRILSFQNCANINQDTMPMLPAGLHSLEVANCPGLNSDILEAFLATSGTTLRRLKLNNNQAMSLGFMANLKALCPHLEHLECDMVYIDPSSWRDRDPLFDELLPNGPPTWPTKLITISMENMRQITEADAEKFFASLVDASTQLSRLKKLNLKVILKDASWRDRAKLRQKWEPQIESVFLNTDAPVPIRSKPASAQRHSSSQRQSTRLANITKQLSLGGSGSDSDASSIKTGHARCDVVDLVISDQRPAETQYHEDDFLDSEPEDDGEYRD
jgi:hypothetical protein